MSGIFAEVGADLRIHGEGNAIAGMNRAAGAATKLSSAFEGVGRAGAASMASLGSYVAGAIDKLALLSAGLVMAGGAAAGGAAFSAIKTGLTQVNASIENSKIGFASLFNMFGASSSIGEGLGMAGELMGQIRKDAAALPGETQDFVSMAQVLTGPLLQAGKGIKEIRDLTRDTVVSAASLSIPFEVASREMGMLLQGMASSHMPLASKLGIHANTQVNGKEWHDASTAERYAFIEEKLKKAKDTLPLFERSWSGLTSTMADKWHGFLGAATQPLFEGIKHSMVRGLKWMDMHQAQIDQLSTKVGVGLANAWYRVENIAARVPEWVAAARAEWARWEPRVESLVNSIVEGFKQAWPYVEKIGTFLGRELQDPAKALKELVAVRLAAGGMQMAPGLLNAGGSIAQMLRGAGASGAAGSALTGAAATGGAAEGVAISSAQTASLVATPGEILPGMLAGGAAPAGIGELVGFSAAAAAATIALGMLAGAAHLATVDPSKETGALAVQAGIFHTVLGSTKDDLRSLGGSFTRLGTSLWHTVEPLVDLLGVGLIGAVDLAVLALRALLWPIEKLAGAIAWVVSKIPGYGHDTDPTDDPEKDREKSWQEYADERSGKTARDDADARQHANAIIGTMKYGATWGFDQPQLPGYVDATRTPPKKELDKPPVFHNAKFEIKLDARNEAPDRIVRRVFDAVGRAVSRPLVSAYAPSRGF